MFWCTLLSTCINSLPLLIDESHSISCPRHHHFVWVILLWVYVQIWHYDFNFIFLLLYDVEYFSGSYLFSLNPHWWSITSCLGLGMRVYIYVNIHFVGVIHTCGYARSKLGVLCFIPRVTTRGLLQDLSLHIQCSFLDVDCILLGLEPSWVNT